MITSVQTVLTCSKLISPQALNQVIQFVYGGQVDTKVCNLRDMRQVSLLIESGFEFKHKFLRRIRH